VLECTPGVVEPLLKVLATAAALSKAAAHGYHHDGDGDHGGHHATDDSSPFTPGSCTGGAETRTPVGAAGGGGEGGGGGMGAPAPPPPLAPPVAPPLAANAIRQQPSKPPTGSEDSEVH
jgi:hypothetical protein